MLRYLCGVYGVVEVEELASERRKAKGERASVSCKRRWRQMGSRCALMSEWDPHLGRDQTPERRPDLGGTKEREGGERTDCLTLTHSPTHPLGLHCRVPDEPVCW
uniref:Uncharacterized protein n=1 Tax=Nelumbo nucifera TaxID=4432 RepID=A0A822Z7D2_NELNU|nr:TPA_asm: hypothetical protein HUJ06_014843 [Nelumbo nucifera]